jgi:hypothetical protein
VSTATVRRIRVISAEHDPLLSRLRISHLLAGAELVPSALPPSALLLVRALNDPLPRTLPLDGGISRPPPAWERAVGDRLAEALRTARRPVREAVPANAGSVVFADRAELLACLARDARDGTAAGRWWWRQFEGAALTGPAPAAVVAERWLEAPEDVPAALELLAAQGLATQVVEWLTAPACRALTTRLMARFGLPVVTVVEGPASPPVAPWAAVVPEAAGLHLPRAQLLGVALTLRRAPALARTRAFAAAAAAAAAVEASPEAAAPSAAWQAVADPRAAAREPAARGVGHASGETTPSGRPANPARPAGQALPEPLAEPAPFGGTPSPSIKLPRIIASAAVAPAAERSPRRLPEVRSQGALATGREAPEDGRRPPGRPTSPQRPPSGPPVPEHAPLEVTAPVRWGSAPVPSDGSGTELHTLAPVETALGGAFYLLNLALFLGLYGDFTQPLERGIALNPWDLVAMLAHRLVGPAVRSDPLWRLLARLAGRPVGSAPGAGFRPPRAWRTPSEWLAPFEPAGEWRWSAAQRTLRVLHPDGFTIAAAARTALPAEVQLQRELRRLRVAQRPAEGALRRTSLAAEPRRPLDRWVARLAGYAEARLRRTLGLEPGADLAAVLVRRRARVFIGPGHVDIVLSLTELPVSVRFAGLDRNPGWLPAAGRHVDLHFT